MQLRQNARLRVCQTLLQVALLSQVMSKRSPQRRPAMKTMQLRPKARLRACQTLLQVAKSQVLSKRSPRRKPSIKTMQLRPDPRLRASQTLVLQVARAESSPLKTGPLTEPYKDDSISSTSIPEPIAASYENSKSLSRGRMTHDHSITMAQPEPHTMESKLPKQGNRKRLARIPQAVISEQPPSKKVDIDVENSRRRDTMSSSKRPTMLKNEERRKVACFRPS
jgi:hypothetical protein